MLHVDITILTGLEDRHYNVYVPIYYIKLQRRFVCVRACVRVCVRTCVRACVHAYVHACVCAYVRACVRE